MRLRRLLMLLLTLAPGAVGAALTPVVSDGTPSPLGLPFSTFRNVTLLGDRRVAFLGASTATFRRAGGLVRVIAAGDVLPDGASVAGASPPALGPEGCVAMRVSLIGGGGRILRRCGSSVEAVAAAGDVLADGRVLAELVDTVAYGAGGQIAFGSVLDDGSTGLFVWSNGALASVVRTGTPGPSGGVVTALRLVGVTGDGRVGFRGGVASGRDGLFMASGGAIRRVVEVGEPSALGGTFATLDGASINDAGNWVFRGSLSDGGRAGIFHADTSEALPLTRPVVLEGEQIFDPTVTVRTIPSSLTPGINANGAVVFRVTLSGGESGSAVSVVSRPGERPQRILGAGDKTPLGLLVRLRDPVIADDESVVIPASISGEGPALLVSRVGGVTALAQVGEATDIDAGQERFRFTQPSVRGRAEEAVFAGSREGVFVARPDGSVEMLAFVGGPAPPPLGGTFTGFDPPVANAAGTVAFGAEIQDSPEASRAIIANRSGGLRVVARSLQRVRGGKLVDFFAGTVDSLTRGDVGPGGEIAFDSTLQGGRAPGALMLQRGGRPQPGVRARERAPGGGEFDSFGTPALLRGGMAFVARVSGAGEAAPELFLRRGKRTRRLAGRGTGVPGRLGGRFEDFDPPDANDAMVGFRATTDRGGAEGVFLASRRRVALLVGTGDRASDGTPFRSFSAPSLGRTRAVFLGRRVGTTVPPALYAADASTLPADDAPPPPVVALVGPGDPTPLGGRVGAIDSFSANGNDAVAAVIDLVGAGAHSAVVLID